MHVLATFNGNLPRRPYCTNDPSIGIKVRPLRDALTYSHIQLNSPGKTSLLIFDVDHSDAAMRWDDVGLPEPTITVQNPSNGHAHLMYGLQTPVCTSKQARQHPMRYLAAVEQAMMLELGADPGYSGLIAKNPAHPRWRTTWGSKLYELGDSCHSRATRDFPRSGHSSATLAEFAYLGGYALASL